MKAKYLPIYLIFIVSCKFGYKVEDNKVYYYYCNEAVGQGKSLVDNADANTFEEIKIKSESGFYFGKDKNFLYIDGNPIKNIDPNTFKYLKNYTFRDKHSAYFFGFYNDLNDCSIKGVNPDKLKFLTYPWAKVDNILIHGKDTISIDDINDFVSLDEDWGKTKKYIIYKNQVLYDSDIESFKIVSSYEGKDKNYNYYSGYIDEKHFVEKHYKTFDFEKNNIEKLEPTVFIDLYDKPDSFQVDQNEKIILVENLKSKGYTIKNYRISNDGETNVITVYLKKNYCDCFVEKHYHYNYSIQKVDKVTERIHCKPNKEF